MQEEEARAISRDWERQLKNEPWEPREEVSNVPATPEAVAYKGGCLSCHRLSRHVQSCLVALREAQEPVCPENKVPSERTAETWPWRSKVSSSPAGKVTAALLGRGGGMFGETGMLPSEKHPTGM